MYTMQLKLKSIKRTALTCLPASDKNLNHMQSKCVPHHVNNKAKIGHLNTRSLIPKIDEIQCIVHKTILTFFVSVKLGYMNT